MYTVVKGVAFSRRRRSLLTSVARCRLDGRRVDIAIRRFVDARLVDMRIGISGEYR